MNDEDLDYYLSVIGNIGSTFEEVPEDVEDGITTTKTTVQNAPTEFIDNITLYGPGGTREEQQNIKIRIAVGNMTVKCDPDSVISYFSKTHKEMYHLLNPETCIYAYIRLHDKTYKKMSWENFSKSLRLTKEHCLDIIRYLRKYDF